MRRNCNIQNTHDEARTCILLKYHQRLSLSAGTLVIDDRYTMYNNANSDTEFDKIKILILFWVNGTSEEYLSRCVIVYIVHVLISGEWKVRIDSYM